MPSASALFRPLRLRLALALACAGAAALAAFALAHAANDVDKKGAPAAAPAPFYATPFERQPDVPTLTRLGRALFADRVLSASGRTACISCHDPAHAYGPPNALAVQLAGPNGREPGLRAVPSLRYSQATPPFSEHFYDADGNDSEDQGPTGGFFWDGRASSAHDQAEGPLLSPFEMANPSRQAVLERLARSPNAQALRDAFGARLFDNQQLAWNALVLSLEVFQQSPADFYPYSSRYDAFLRGQTKLSPTEMRGLALFNDQTKGNCASCHLSGVKRGAFPQFTDQGLIALGVPRNPAIPANRDSKFFDMGLCGPLRTDLKDHPEYCGLFKTPSLRNVATRKVFFHNGVYRSLEEVMRFYVQRDTNPERFYSRDVRGRVRKYDDLPDPRYSENVNTDPPFDRKPGDKPALSEAEIRDVIAFLRTLNDGWKPPSAAPAARAKASR
ncbi:MAG TPA: cytochrome c peroxidase [Burkholderiaceae bacterium]